MQHHDNGRLTLARFPRKNFEHGDLVFQIEVSRRFVKKKQAWRLRQQGGDGQTLPFAAGKRLHVAPFHAVQPDGGQRRAGNAHVVLRLPVPAVKVRMAADQCRFQYRRSKGVALRLRQPAAQLCGLPRTEGGIGASGQVHFAGQRRAQPGEYGKQRRFAGPVASENRQPLPRPQGQIKVAAKTALTDADRQPAQLQDRRVLVAG